MTKKEITKLIDEITTSDNYDGYSIRELDPPFSTQSTNDLYRYEVKIALSNKYDYTLHFFHEFIELSKCGGFAIRCECNKLYMMAYYYIG